MSAKIINHSAIMSVIAYFCLILSIAGMVSGITMLILDVFNLGQNVHLTIANTLIIVGVSIAGMSSLMLHRESASHFHYDS